MKDYPVHTREITNSKPSGVQDMEDYPVHTREITNSKPSWGQGGNKNKLNKAIRSIPKDAWDKTGKEWESTATA